MDGIRISRPIRLTKSIPSKKLNDCATLPENRKPVCSICQLKVSSKESLRRHILTKHIKQKIHECTHCGKSFVLEFRLTEHMKVCPQNSISSDAIICICGRRFNKRNSYLKHVRRVHNAAPIDRPFCSECGKTFNDRDGLITHKSRIHAEKSILCNYESCNKVFSSVSHRNAHMRVHDGVQYPCDECGKVFSTASYRNKHLLSHSGIRLYDCLTCGLKCLTASHLTIHIKRKHSEPLYNGTTTLNNAKLFGN